MATGAKKKIDLAEIKIIVRSLLISNPAQCSVRRLCNDFFEFNGYELPYRDLGFNEPDSFLSSLTDVCKVIGTGRYAVVNPIVRAEVAHINNMVCKQKIKSSPFAKRQSSSASSSLRRCSTPCPSPKSTREVPEDVRNNLRRLIQLHPRGILCTDLPIKYWNLYKKELSYVVYQYRSLVEMCLEVPDILRCIPISQIDYLLLDKTKPAEGVVERVEAPQSLDDEEFCDPMNCMHLEFKKPNYPENVLIKTDKISRIFKFKRTDEGNKIMLGMGEVYDASKFWVYLTDGPLFQLMDELQIFYCANKSDYFVSESDINEGLYCVALYNQEYHRIVIINTMPNMDGKVKVFYIDYGIVDIVDIRKLWFLHKQFASVPHQAIRAKLSNIIPSVECSPWPLETTNAFRGLTTGQKKFIGEITYVNTGEKVPELYVADVTDRDNIFYLNDFLIQQDLALYADQEQYRSLSVVNKGSAINSFHLYPEFDVIETGMVPTGREILHCLERNLSVDQYHAYYFNPLQDKNLDRIQNDHDQFNREPKTILFPPLKKISNTERTVFYDRVVEALRKMQNLCQLYLNNETITERLSNSDEQQNFLSNYEVDYLSQCWDRLRLKKCCNPPEELFHLNHPPSIDLESCMSEENPSPSTITAPDCLTKSPEIIRECRDTPLVNKRSWEFRQIIGILDSNKPEKISAPNTITASDSINPFLNDSYLRVDPSVFHPTNPFLPDIIREFKDGLNRACNPDPWSGLNEESEPHYLNETSALQSCPNILFSFR